jgi:hypothetical protein
MKDKLIKRLAKRWYYVGDFGEGPDFQGSCGMKGMP